MAPDGPGRLARPGRPGSHKSPKPPSPQNSPKSQHPIHLDLQPARISGQGGQSAINGGVEHTFRHGDGGIGEYVAHLHAVGGGEDHEELFHGRFSGNGGNQGLQAG